MLGCRYTRLQLREKERERERFQTAFCLFFINNFLNKFTYSVLAVGYARLQVHCAVGGISFAFILSFDCYLFFLLFILHCIVLQGSC